jgi:ribulose-phosphate 3-epimerase
MSELSTSDANVEERLRAAAVSRAAALRGPQLAPSVLAADFTRLGEQVESVLTGGARVVHIDVMDGHFVPSISFGPVVVEALAEQVHGHGAVLDVHLMIDHPELQVEPLASAGADSITAHWEATSHLHYVLQSTRAAGCAAGVALCPATPVEVVRDVVAAGVVDLVLCMSVNPGWGNQQLIPHSFTRLRQLRELLPDDVALEVDGGVNATTAHACVEAGANLLVAGTAVFAAPEPGAALTALASAAWPAD